MSCFHFLRPKFCTFFPPAPTLIDVFIETLRSETAYSLSTDIMGIILCNIIY